MPRAVWRHHPVYAWCAAEKQSHKKKKRLKFCVAFCLLRIANDGYDGDLVGTYSSYSTSNILLLTLRLAPYLSVLTNNESHVYVGAQKISFGRRQRQEGAEIHGTHIQACYHTHWVVGSVLASLSQSIESFLKSQVLGGDGTFQDWSRRLLHKMNNTELLRKQQINVVSGVLTTHTYSNSALTTRWH